MSVLAEFLLAMSFPVASVTLGAWLIWRRSRSAAEAKRLRTAERERAIVRFTPERITLTEWADKHRNLDASELRDRLMPYQREFLERLKLEHGNALSPESEDPAAPRAKARVVFCDEIATGPQGVDLARIKSDLAKFASAMRALGEAFRGFARSVAMTIDSAARSEARRLNLRRQAARKGKPGWKRRGSR